MAPPAPKAKAAATKVARPVARYRPGKAPVGADASIDDYSDSDQSDDHLEQDGTTAAQQNDVGIKVTDLSAGTAALLSGPQRKTAGIIVNEAGPSNSKKLDLRLHSTAPTAAAQEDSDSSEYETDTDEEAARAKPVFRKPGAPAPAPQAEESGSSEYETDSEEEDSEEESAPPPLLKPIFVPKRARTTIAASAPESAEPGLDAEAKAEAEAAQRRKEAHDLAAATVQRSLLETKQAQSESTEVDDTDGLDPEGEFEAWRQRELSRLARDREAILVRQKELEELESFRSLPEAEKERLGRERAAQQAAEKKEQRGNPGFMQKYYHKGSFFQDMDILKRDYTETTSKDVDVSKLPKMMQVRGGTMGVKGRSKWTHLANEDTSKAAMRVEIGGRGKRGCFVCGGEHLKKDCPRVNGQGEGSGANKAEHRGDDGVRKWGERREGRERSRSPRREEKDRHAPRSRAPRDRYDEEGSRRSESSRSQDHRSHRSREEGEHHRDHEQPSSSSRSDDRDRDRDHGSRRHREDDDRRHRHRSHRDRDDSDRDRERHRDRHHHSKSDRHGSDDRKHRRHDDERDRHKRRERDDRHNRHHHSSGSRREEESERKRSRLEA